MPLYKTIIASEDTTIKIWKITELYSELRENTYLKPENETRLLGMKSEIHRCGFLSIRHLLKLFGYTDEDLYYNENGKPFLKDGKHISITHSFHFSAVAISNAPIGIDIEKTRTKIIRIASKFINYEDKYLIKEASNYKNMLTIIWCIKESLYKVFATSGLSFYKNTLVIPFMENDEETIAWIDYNKIKQRYTSSFLEFDGFTCAYVLPS